MKDFFNAIQDLFETVLLVPFDALRAKIFHRSLV